jgi:hypothetical protein
MRHLFSCESPSLELSFCHSSLNLGCGYLPGKAQTLPLQLSQVSHTLSHSTVLLPRSLNLRDRVSPQKAVTSSLWETDQSPLLPLEAGLNSNLGSYQSESSASLPLLFPAPHWITLCVPGLHLTPQEVESPSGSSCLSAPGGIFCQLSRGWTPATRKVTSHLCNSSNKSPRNVAGISN